MQPGQQTALAAYLPHLTAALVRHLGGHLEGLALFGSCARGQATAGSDIDLLLVVTAPGAAVDEAIAGAIGQLRDLPEAETLRQLHIDPTPALVVHSVARFADHPLILLDIVQEGRVLADPHGLLARHFAAIRRRLKRLGSQRVELSDGSWYWDLKPTMRAGEEVAI